MLGNITTTEEVIRLLKKDKSKPIYGFLCSGTKDNFTVECYLTNHIRTLKKYKKRYPIAAIVNDIEYDLND